MPQAESDKLTPAAMSKAVQAYPPWVQLLLFAAFAVIGAGGPALFGASKEQMGALQEQNRQVLDKLERLSADNTAIKERLARLEARNP